MSDHILRSAKAYAALVGAVLAVVVAQSPDPVIDRWAALGIAICSAIAVYRIPNRATPSDGKHRAEDGSADVGLILLVLILLGVVLLLFRVHLGG